MKESYFQRNVDKQLSYKEIRGVLKDNKIKIDSQYMTCMKDKETSRNQSS